MFNGKSDYESKNTCHMLESKMRANDDLRVHRCVLCLSRSRYCSLFFSIVDCSPLCLGQPATRCISCRPKFRVWFGMRDPFIAQDEDLFGCFVCNQMYVACQYIRGEVEAVPGNAKGQLKSVFFLLPQVPEV